MHEFLPVSNRYPTRQIDAGLCLAKSAEKIHFHRDARVHSRKTIDQPAVDRAHALARRARSSAGGRLGVVAL